MTVTGMKRFVFLAVVPEKQAAVGKHAVDIENDQPHLAGFLGINKVLEHKYAVGWVTLFFG